MSSGSYIQVAEVGQVNKMDGKCVHVDDLQIALFRVSDEEICAIGNICPHQGAPLADGVYDIEEGTVTCPLHAWEFNVRTGRRVNGLEAVTTYQTRIVGNFVEVLVGRDD